MDGTRILEDFHVEYHLKGHHKDDQRACHGEGFNIYVEEAQKEIASKIERHKQSARNKRGLGRTDGAAVRLEVDKDRRGAQHVDDGEENDKGADHLLPVQTRNNVMDVHHK